MVLSRHPSHQILRAVNKTLPLFPFKSVIRLGSTTVLTDDNERIQINTPEAVKNSASKLLMKQKFTEVGVKTAKWFITTDLEDLVNKAAELTNNWQIPLVAKSLYGSRGIGNSKINNEDELVNWNNNKNLSNYIFEQFIKMTREYRLHVTDYGCFYTCRKLLKNDAPEGTWQKHDDVCSWALEDNPSFKKPNNWDEIVQDCIKAKNALGLDICAFDVMVQGAKDGVERINPEWNICESCSAPSMGTITGIKYIEELPKLIIRKYNSQ